MDPRGEDLARIKMDPSRCVAAGLARRFVFFATR
jgi:hypothetical protein